MVTFNILALDDKSDREEDLTKLFESEEFNLTFISDFNEYSRSVDSFPQYDCIVCDISLDGWVKDAKDLFYRVIDDIGKKKPIVLYSSVMTTVLQWTNKLLEEKYNLIYTFDWDQLIKAKDSYSMFRNNLRAILTKELRYTPTNINKDDTINILHISDIQFGDPSHDENLTNTFIESLVLSMQKNVIPKIDFVAITGDFAYDASPSQYEKARIWIVKLCKNIFGSDNFQDRLLLVPGNHDVNLSLSALNKYQYHFPESEEQEGNVNFDKRENEINDYTLYSVNPFRNFAFSLTSDDNWLKSESMSFVNYKFSYLGLIFIHLNMLDPKEQLGMRDAKFKLDDDIILKFKDEYNSLNIKKEKASIILAHSSPKYLGYDTDENHTRNWISIANFFKNINALTYMYGHRHKNLLNRQIPLDSEKNMRICGVSTLLCEPDIGDNRGFKVLQLKRNNNIIVGEPKILPYRYMNDGTIKDGD